ncbi:DUF3034 family protein [Gilvimarinus sp. SDUM040013]|uniref:DUF3034 family protein n=1 Tax=Gilvimarinus gilvus TaxID=3058038 RepID=A0ABU4S241_9GAMM|nr:DUF3034 family protein [Gilvimarinus sp. SDUM040013]MDO3388091.1 DUF3034 family protein [Gilvimarinus sp. SDUM040013]MDX6850999.1 DUF3034 family protein [Gilvimarinus sp. SDUM040013]
MKKYLLVMICLLGAGFVSAAENRSRIIATGAATTIDGSAGGGIVPMAALSGYGAREESGGVAFASYVHVPDYTMSAVGGSWSWRNRVEFSLADQRLEHPTLSAALGVPLQDIRQSVAGVKVRLLGDILYSKWPQLSAGVMYKHNHDFTIPGAAGAKRDSDSEAYLAASKVFLGGAMGYNLLVNGVARYTRANQIGLVGFGGDKNDSRRWYAEASAGIFYNKHLLFGAEFKQKPDNLSFAGEDDWQTLFAAWFPNKKLALVAAYVDLGEVATLPNQDGWYLSVQGSF